MKLNRDTALGPAVRGGNGRYRFGEKNIAVPYERISSVFVTQIAKSVSKKAHSVGRPRNRSDPDSVPAVHRIPAQGGGGKTVNGFKKSNEFQKNMCNRRRSQS